MSTNVYIENGAKQKKRTEIIILSAVLAIILIIGACVGAYFVLNGSSGKEDFNHYLDIANKYVEKGNYQDAIKNYWIAIEKDQTKEIAYTNLGGVYEVIAEPVNAIDVYSLGYRRTNSSLLADKAISLSIMIYGRDTTGDKNTAGGSNTQLSTIMFNKSFVTKLSNYTFDNYKSDYGEPVVNASTGKYTAAYNNGNITLYYYNTADTEIIDPVTNAPKPGRRPNEISLSTLSYIFTGMEDRISYETISSMGLDCLSKGYDKELGKEVIKFNYNDCKVVIECDSDGSVGIFAWNRLYPNLLVVQGGDKTDTLTLGGKIINAVNGEAVQNARVFIYSASDPSVPINDCTTGTSGDYLFEELEEGDYIVEVISDGFIEEKFEINVNSWENLEGKDLTISPELRVGEIRIVLTWNSTPRDLDSYLDGTSSVGDSVHINYMNKEHYSANGDCVATLDVDDTDGNGPETTTIYDIGGDYTYTVRDFTRSGTMAAMGATVKVYIGNSAPQVFEVPSDVIDGWEVFRLHNGNLEVINSAVY